MANGQTGAPFEASVWDGLHWQPIPSPGGTGAILLAFDGARSLLTALTPTATWTFDGVNWTQVASDGPKHIAGGSLAYDPRARKLVFFGGACDSGFGLYCAASETWTWDGSSWTQQHPATVPGAPRTSGLGDVPAFSGGSLPRLLMVDEHLTSPTSTLEVTMWEWDAANWIALHPSTLPAYGQYMRMAVDEAKHQLVLFEGVPAQYESGNQTWIYAGDSWVKKATA